MAHAFCEASSDILISLLPPMHPSALIPLALLPLIAWRMYRRVRRLVGRQPSVARRHWSAAVLFPALLLLLGAGALNGPTPQKALVALGAGAALGIALGVIGLRTTRFEVTEQGLFYTPNAHIGIALSLLLAVRVLYRLFQGFEGAFMQASGFATSPLTLLAFATLAGYYASYAIGLLRWRASVPSPVRREPSR